MRDAITKFSLLLKQNGIPFVIVSGSMETNGVKPTDLKIVYNDLATDQQISLGNSLANSFDWRRDPDINGFISAIATDSNLSSQVRTELAKYFPLLQMSIDNIALLQSGWNDLLSAYSSTWLTNAMQTEVLKVAQQYDIPLNNTILYMKKPNLLAKFLNWIRRIFVKKSR